MNKILISLVCFVFLVGLGGVVSAVINVDPCDIIQNLTNDTTCINTTSSNMSFDSEYNADLPPRHERKKLSDGIEDRKRLRHFGMNERAKLLEQEALRFHKNKERKAKHKEGELIVKFKSGTSSTEKAEIHSGINSKVLREFKRVKGAQLLELPLGVDVIRAMEHYRSNPLVEYAEPNYIVEILATPNDPNFVDLWGIEKINASEAWDVSTGNGDVVVAVIDTGVDYTHEDLADNIWVNPNENCTDGVDNDDNGYVDDCYGIDTYNDDSDPMDDNGHGTHVSGTIGAVGNNSIGVVGVNWNVSIMAVKFLGASGGGTTADAIDGLDYVLDMKNRGINIVATSNSWGGGGYSQALRDAIEAQMNAGILFIAAAGNDANDNDMFPAYPASYDLPNIISVAATDSSDGLASFSNYGEKSVYVGAPGVGIFSTLPPGAYLTPRCNDDDGDGYGYCSGTSMATPHVSGLAALLKAQNASFDWKQIKNLILAGGRDTPALDRMTVTGKTINAYGSLTCTNSSLLSDLILMQDYFLFGESIDLIALSILCQQPADVNVTVYNSTGSVVSVVTLQDDGFPPDLMAGDGVFASKWTPSQLDSYTLEFNNTFVVKSLNITIVEQNSDDCIVINQPGFYRLDNNIVNIRTTCIKITSSNVVFDGQDYTIDGVDNLGTYGVYVYNSTTTLTNVTVKNLVVTDWDNGIYYRNAQNGSIENNTASSNEYGILVEYSSSNTIQGNIANSNYYAGIGLDSSSNNTFSNNNVSNNGDGISLSSSSNNTIINNIANSNIGYLRGFGIYLRDSSNNTITNNTANSNDWDGIYLWDSSNNSITNNTANSNNKNGIYLENSSSSNISNNTANSNNRYGIELYDSSSNTLKGNNMSANNLYNFDIYGHSASHYIQDIDTSNIVDGKPIYYLVGQSNIVVNSSTNAGFVGAINSDNITVEGLTLIKNSHGVLFYNTNNSKVENVNALNNKYGIYLESSSSNTIINNIANSNGEYMGGSGIYLSSSSSNTISNNTANSNYWSGIVLRSSSSNTLSNNTANSNKLDGIDLHSANNNTLSNNTANSNDWDGIDLHSANNNTLSNNTANSNDWYGITLYSANNNTLSNNTANSNNKSGIRLSSSSSNTLKGNNMSANNLYNFCVHGSSYGSTASHYIQDIDTSNIVDGKPIYYLVGQSNIVVNSSTNAGFVGAVNSDNITVEGLTLIKNSHGVLFYNTNNSKVENVNALNDTFGIYLRNSSSNTITSNDANSNNYYGIGLKSSSNNTIQGNIANSNYYAGIGLESSSNNTITNNTANLNTGRGIIYLYSSGSNTVYNNLFNNTNNVYFWGTVYANTWNTTKTPGTNIIGGPYLGGNFWAKPDGTGFSETCTDADGDGICDSNYTLAFGNVDYLPLAVLPPSIDISKIMTAGKTTVYTGTKEYWVLDIEVTNDGQASLGSVVVSDTIPAKITLDDFTASKGTVATTVKNGATKLTWAIGTMWLGDIETLVLDVSTRTDGSTQYFLEPGEYVLNEGASVSGNSGQITAGPTDPITVYAKTAGRSRMGGGRGGGHHRRGR